MSCACALIKNTPVFKCDHGKRGRYGNLNLAFGKQTISYSEQKFQQSGASEQNFLTTSLSRIPSRGAALSEQNFTFRIGIYCIDLKMVLIVVGPFGQ